MDFHVLVETSRLIICHITHVTFEWFQPTVNSVVSDKMNPQPKSFVTNITQKWLLSRMGSHVSCQIDPRMTTSVTLCALELFSMNMHMHIQATTWWIMFLTLSTWINIFTSVLFYVISQMYSRRKLSITHSTRILLCFVIAWMLSSISFGLRLFEIPCICTK